MTESRDKFTNIRINEIDIAKAIGIFCVFIGHRTEGPIHNYVYLFHMPLFFFLSGCMIKEEKNFFLKKFFVDTKLLSSYLIYSCIFILYGIVKNPNIISFLLNVINSCTFYGIHSLWFLSSLWIGKLVIRFLFEVRNRYIRHGIIVSIYVVCYWLSVFLIKQDYHGMIEQVLKSLSWSFVRVGVILIFVYLGFVMKRYLGVFVSYFRQHIFLTIIVMVVTGVMLMPFTAFNAVDYHLLKNGLFIINVMYGGIGTVFILSISIVIAKFFKGLTKICVFVGRNSLHYMASEFFGLSAIVSFNKLLGWFDYIRYVEFAVYFALLSTVVWFLGPIIDDGIRILNSKVNLLVNRLCKMDVTEV